MGILPGAVRLGRPGHREDGFGDGDGETAPHQARKGAFGGRGACFCMLLEPRKPSIERDRKVDVRKDFQQ